MSDDKDPATEKCEQLEQFLKWRGANFKRRTARRRRWFRYVAVVSFVVIGVALVTWVTESARGHVGESPLSGGKRHRRASLPHPTIRHPQPA